MIGSALEKNPEIPLGGISGFFYSDLQGGPVRFRPYTHIGHPFESRTVRFGELRIASEPLQVRNVVSAINRQEPDRASHPSIVGYATAKYAQAWQHDAFAL